jgi:hypothetical protein
MDKMRFRLKPSMQTYGLELGCLIRSIRTNRNFSTNLENLDHLEGYSKTLFDLVEF